jgi:uncharacterized membrane protein YdbT with pleckstrin-like domain
VTYVDQHLNPGETVAHRTTLHPVIFLAGALLAGLALVFLASSDLAGVGGLVLVIALAVLLITWLRYTNSEFAVTTSRVVIKVGWLSRHTLELQLNKVEAISVNQDLMARLLDYGTLVVSGTGGTKEAFSFIKAPIAFRQSVQHQTELASHQVVASPAAPLLHIATDARRERDCPYCAERILAKATRCRFCGQTVVPLA